MKKIVFVLIVAFLFSFGSVLADDDWSDKDKIYWMAKCVSVDRSFDVCHCIMVKILKKKKTGKITDADVESYLLTCLGEKND